MKVTARFRVRFEGWVTATREVEAFDITKADDLGSDENDILDSMADDALADAGEYISGEINDTEVLSVEP